MRTLSRLFILAVLLLFFVGGCGPCPNQDIVQCVITPFGLMVVQTDKNNYAEEFHSLEQFKDGTGWITLEEYKAWIAELEKEREAKDSI